MVVVWMEFLGRQLVRWGKAVGVAVRVEEGGIRIN